MHATTTTKKNDNKIVVTGGVVMRTRAPIQTGGIVKDRRTKRNRQRGQQQRRALAEC